MGSDKPSRGYGFATVLPACAQPMMPSDITATSEYPASTARRAASCDAIQWVFAQ